MRKWMEEDYEDDEDDLEQGDPGVLKLLRLCLPSVIPLCESGDLKINQTISID